MRIPTAAAAAFVMAALAQIAAPPAFGQAIPDSLKQAGNTEASIKEKRNAWTVGVAGGLMSGSYMTFADQLAKALDDGDNLRVLPMVTYGAASNVDDLLYLRGVDVAVTQSDVFEYFKTERKIWNLQNRIHYIIRLPVSEVHILARRDIRTPRGPARQEGQLRSGRCRIEPDRHAGISAARHPGRTSQYRHLERTGKAEVRRNRGAGSPRRQADRLLLENPGRCRAASVVDPVLQEICRLLHGRRIHRASNIRT